MIPGTYQLLALFQSTTSQTKGDGALPLDATTAEPVQMVGYVAVALLILSLSAVAVVCAYLILSARSRANALKAQARRDREEARLPDPWEEASRRLALEDDDSIPREPGSS